MAHAPDPALAAIQEILDGTRQHAALVAAIEVRLCEHLADGPATPEELAYRAGVSTRGAQALLDALVAFGLVEVQAGRYRNGRGADAYLVPGRPGYLGDEQIGLWPMQLEAWSRLADRVQSGQPVYAEDSDEMLAFWTLLTPVIARRGRAVAEEAVRLLQLHRGAPSLLDVGGGQALYSLALLGLNPDAHATQADWPHVNEQAKAAVRAAGYPPERFDTLDGDLRTMSFGDERFDVAVLSNIIHQEGEAQAVELLARVHGALRPDGRLVVSELVVDEGRTGPRRPLLFNLNMLTHSRAGKSYARDELEAIITGAGFARPSVHPVEGSDSTLLVAVRE